MTHKQFFDIVKKMREQQKRYFQTRREDDLKESKRIEKEVDNEIDRVGKVLEEKNNPRLF